MSGSRYKAYPKYRESDVEWLDFVPNHWKSVPLKYMALSDGALFLDGDWIESKDLAEDGIRYITTGNVGEGAYKEQGAGFISEAKFKQLNCSEVFAGDVLISRLNLPIGRACVVPPHETRIVTSVDNVIFRPDGNFAKEFLVYLFSSAEYFLHTSNLARGATMQRISRGLLGNVRASIPPLPEQTQIAAFLDHETAKIDRLIEKQQGLIALLKEKRQAVISHAVTQGLNPHAPRKDSGIEWLGQVPEHWEMKKIKHLACSIEQGWSPQCDGQPADENEWGVLKVGCVNGGVFNRTENKLLPAALRPVPELAVNQDDLLISRANTRELVGSAAVALRDYPRLMICDKLYRIRFHADRCEPRFISHYLGCDAVRGEIELEATGASASMLNIGQSAILELAVATPSREEQLAIISFLEIKTAKFDSLNTEAHRAVTLLQERRTALISAAVTGKIDVRAWQPPVVSELETTG